LNRNTLGMDGSQVGVFEERHEISLTSLLKRQDGRGLETEIGLEVLGNLTNKALEGKLPDEEFSALLVLADFTKSDSSGTETMRFLHTSGGGRCALLGLLGGKLLAGSLATGRLAGGLLGAGHW